MWRANLIGLSASWLLRIKKRVYTRHHATVHYREHPSGRKWDLLCNFLATDIIAISENIKEILIKRDNAKPRKISIIPHGFDLAYFQSISPEQIEKQKLKLQLQGASPVIGVIARFTKWKGVQHVITAFAQIRGTHPGAVLILANATGDYSAEIKKMLTGFPPETYREIFFENDLAALYKQFDVYVHTPTDSYAEAFGQTYVEALASGVPSVFTLSGVAREFIQHNHNALVVPFENPEAIAASIHLILSNKKLREKLILNGKNSVEPFGLGSFVQKLKLLYGR